GDPLRLGGRVHPVDDDAAHQHHHAGHRQDDGQRGLVLLVLDLEAHPLFLQARLRLHARAALGLLQAHVAFALVRQPLLLDAPDAIFFVAPAALDVFAGAALRILARPALGLDARLRIGLLLPNAVVLDPTE